MIDRRTLLRHGPISAAAALIRAPAPAAVPKRIGLQMFTVERTVARDLPATIAAIAAIGYREIETMGAQGLDPHALRRLLDANGLVSRSQHLLPGTLYETFAASFRGEIPSTAWRQALHSLLTIEHIDANFTEAAARASILGQKYIVSQEMSHELMTSRAGLETLCRAMNRAGAICRDHGLKFNYHNHDFEFATVDGVIPFDVIMAGTDPRLVGIELDIYWLAKAGGDPIATLERYRGRIDQIHLKDKASDGAIAGVGLGTLPIARIVKTAEATGVGHFYVEVDRPVDPLLTARTSFEAVRKML